MKLLNSVIFSLALLLVAGCSSTRQFKDNTWTNKPSNMKAVFTKPVIVQDSTESYELGSLWGFFKSEKDTAVVTDEMTSISAWFQKNLDNTFKFNLGVHYSIDEVSKEQISSVAEKMDGDDVNIPKLSSMSDSFEVYLVMDDIRLYKSQSYSQMSSVPMASVAGPAAPMYKSGEKVKVSANYAFYDAKSGKMLAFGFVEKDHFAEKRALEHDWVDVVRDMALQIIDQTPVGQ
ncbi:MAG: hypothetical protein IIT53_09595 [Fibrobacter sp.]|nr:hypothetical protein [Fibrobacter sp.]